MFCPNCGKEYFENQNFCRYCGAKLNENNVNVENNEINENNVNNENNENSTISQDFSENQQIKENSVEEGNVKTVYNIDLITGVPSEGNINQSGKDGEAEETDKTAETDENSGDVEALGQEDKSEEQKTNFDEISENEEYKKYKKELLQKRTQYLDKQVAEKRTEEFEKQQKKLSSKAIVGIGVLVIFLVFFGNLLWSIDVETQITPSETGEAPELNLPTEDERTYTQEPERTVQEEPPVVEENSGMYSEKAEETPEQDKAAEDKPIEKQAANPQHEPIKEVKEVKKAPAPVEPPIPPMPKVQEPSLNFEPVGN